MSKKKKKGSLPFVTSSHLVSCRWVSMKRKNTRVFRKVLGPWQATRTSSMEWWSNEQPFFKGYFLKRCIDNNGGGGGEHCLRYCCRSWYICSTVLRCGDWEGHSVWFTLSRNHSVSHGWSGVMWKKLCPVAAAFSGHSIALGKISETCLPNTPSAGEMTL